MKRRDLFTAGAAAAAIPAGALAQPHAHIVPQTAVANAAAWRPAALDDHQNETVIVLSELIIPSTDTPGGKAALVNRHLDKRLAASPAEELDRWISGIAWLDGYAIRLHGHSYVNCSEAQQIAILETLDTSKDDSLRPGAAFFRLAKFSVSAIYYATEIGAKELNKGGRVPATFACPPAKA